MTWNDSFINYAVDIARIYKTHPEQIITCLRFDSVAGSLNETYQVLVREKEIKPIEDLPETEKRSLWNQAKNHSDKKEKCILISKCIHLLNQLTKGDQ